MKSNKKGMTLVECIVAMAVFAVATTGFTMAATACMKAQTKSSKRMSQTNVQSTNLEHFSTFSKVLDPEYSNVRRMSGGTNQFRMTFEFKNNTVVNDNIYGYYALLDPSEKDKVYELSFFSAADQVDLSDGWYWVTLYNFSSSPIRWAISCDTDFAFFDNEGNTNEQQSLPDHSWAANGGYMKFGIKKNSSGGSTGATFTLTPITENGYGTDQTVTFNDTYMPNGTLDNGGKGDNMVSIYYYNEAFMNPDDFAEAHPEA